MLANADHCRYHTGRTMKRIAACLSLILLAPVPVAAQTPAVKADKAATARIETVAVSGCLTESTPGTWKLVNASDPVPSTANAPSPKELASLPQGGKNEFQLIGVSIYNLPAHKDKVVVVKGLVVAAKPTSRLNMTSITVVAPTCKQVG
jgi:hypothetical protein